MTTLLFDADILMFSAAQSSEVATETRDGYWTWKCEFKDVQRSFDERVKYFMEALQADNYKLFVSDNEYNFRKDVYPQYKTHRDKKKRPVTLKPFRKYLIEERGAEWLPGLEGDDLCGIYATGNYIEDNDKIIISADKDLKTIPGYLFRENEVKWYSEEEADYWHLYQTLVGDQTDGYFGCRGIGAKKAEAILKDPTWGAVVKAYEAAEMTEEDALVQARCARILRDGDYDMENKKVILWSPVRI